MNRITYIKIAGKSYPMSFSLGASKKIVEKYGSAEKMKSSLAKAKDAEKIDIVIDMMELLISQGCAYKNYFEKDIPAPEDAPIVDGKWTALPKEAMEIAIGIYDINDMADKIMECIGTGTNKEVEAKPEGKNMQATQE